MQWIKSPTARRILVHWADPRPAWLWSADGSRLIWRNEAARLFLGRVKKWGLKLAPDAVPIRGQVARLYRLGSVGRSSLSRIQFLAGDRPVSTTCTCTPLLLPGDERVLLIVGVDPIDAEVLELHGDVHADPLCESLFPAGADYLVFGDAGQVAGGSQAALERYAGVLEDAGLPAIGSEDSTKLELAGDQLTVTVFRASQYGALLALLESGTIDQVREDEGIDDEPERPSADQPMLPLGLEPVEGQTAAPPAAVEETWVDNDVPTDGGTRLSSLFDRLAGDAELYGPLTEDDENVPGQSPAGVEELLLHVLEPDESGPRDPIAELIIHAEAEQTPSPPGEENAPAEQASASEETAPEPSGTIWRVSGRGFVADLEPTVTAEAQAAAGGETPAPTEAPPRVPADVPNEEARVRRELDRASRYNFDELGRILSDRVALAQQPPATGAASAREGNRQGSPARGGEGTLINLAGETFILNRLPLGILVFRDQQVLFANRALTDLTGHESIESLRQAGLTSIFPAEDMAAVGPVTHLVRRDGLLLPVNARLQSISWHGNPALMLSASLAESRPVHEAVVKAFAELAAGLREEGFLAADRGGVITQVSLHGRIVLGRDEAELVGQPLSFLIDAYGHEELREFLNRPARFAETARPAIVFAGAAPGVEIALFAEGQAGIVSGYFGFIRRREHAAAPPREEDRLDADMLGRFSRGVRRPLNTIIGFADLIRSAAFGPIDIPRYLEYAADILGAGQEIAGLINEIDDLSQLSGGTYAVQSDALDLVALLDTCVMRVRAQAAARRVLVRSAVSERLPRVKADRASLTQAVLNLLASAIDQSPAGGTVILSAQRNDEGGLTVNVRDSGAMMGDSDERFVVFRDAEPGGGTMAAVHSSVGLALTRSLLKVNALTLTIDPVIGVGTLFSLSIPADLAVEG